MIETMRKGNILILFGGDSNEHEVSLRSAAAIIENLDTTRFEPVLMGITRDGRWRLFEGDLSQLVSGEWEQNSTPAIISPDREVHGIVIFGKKIETKYIHCIIPAMHGQHCEDGAIQGLMELSGIPYVGSRITSSAICFDKSYTHIVCEQAGIPMAKWVLAANEETFENIEKRINDAFGFPCFVKPANSGSSVGCAKAETPDKLVSALKVAFNEDRRVIIEELVTAREIECAVLGNLSTYAPTTGEIVSSASFYDYEAKYKVGASKLVIPAELPEETNQMIKSLATKIYKIMDCRGLARVDFFVREDGSVLFNEINTFPGFTETSMYPKMITSAGMSYKELVTQLIELACDEKYRVLHR